MREHGESFDTSKFNSTCARVIVIQIKGARKHVTRKQEGDHIRDTREKKKSKCIKKVVVGNTIDFTREKEGKTEGER